MTTDEDIKRDTRIARIVHAVLIVLILLAAEFILPLIGSMLGDFGRALPTPLQFVLDFSYFCKKRFFVLIALIVLVIWLDGKLFTKIYQKFGKSWAHVYFWGIMILLLLAASGMVAACYLSVVGMGVIVPG